MKRRHKLILIHVFILLETCCKMRNCHKGIDIPWGTNPQLSESMDKLDISLAEAIALWSGNIVPQLLNSNGNLEDRLRRIFVDGDAGLMGESRDEAVALACFLLSLWLRGCIREDNLPNTFEDAIPRDEEDEAENQTRDWTSWPVLPFSRIWLSRIFLGTCSCALCLIPEKVQQGEIVENSNLRALIHILSDLFCLMINP